MGRNIVRHVPCRSGSPQGVCGVMYAAAAAVPLAACGGCSCPAIDVIDPHAKITRTPHKTRQGYLISHLHIPSSILGPSGTLVREQLPVPVPSGISVLADRLTPALYTKTLHTARSFRCTVSSASETVNSVRIHAELAGAPRLRSIPRRALGACVFSSPTFLAELAAPLGGLD